MNKQIFFALFFMGFLSAEVRNVGSLTELQQQIASQGLVVVKFYAPWCGPCKAMAPLYKKVSDDRSLGSIAFFEVNTEKQMGISQVYGVRSIPTILFFKKGQLVATVTGSKSEGDLRSLIQRYLLS